MGARRREAVVMGSISMKLKTVNSFVSSGSDAPFKDHVESRRHEHASSSVIFGATSIGIENYSDPINASAKKAERV